MKQLLAFFALLITLGVGTPSHAGLGDLLDSRTYDFMDTDACVGMYLGTDHLYCAGYAGSGGNRDALVFRILKNNPILDTAFNGTGYWTYDFMGSADELKYITMKGSGELVAAGKVTGPSYMMLLVSLFDDGTLATNFGPNLDGLSYPCTDAWAGHGVYKDQNDSFIIPGTSQAAQAGNDMLISRIFMDGMGDSNGFGTNACEVDFTNAMADSGLAVFPNAALDKYIVVSTNGSEGVMIRRYNLDGTKDLTFGNAGDGDVIFSHLTITGNPAFIVNTTTAAQRANGKILVAGHFGQTIFILQVDEDGNLDTNFALNGTGILTEDFSDPAVMKRPTAMAVDRRGRVIVTGTWGPDIFVARFKSGGRLNQQFGNSGVTVTSIGPSNDTPLI